ncbi:MAG: hypothetical protein ABSB79_01255 [Syntrophales bacterium]|jgi:hypothetical protein
MDIMIRFQYMVLILSLLLCSYGCGLKSDPVPFSSHKPEQVSDVKAVVTPEGISLSWTYSGKDTQGYRMIIARSDLEGTCETCPRAYKDIADAAFSDIVMKDKPMEAAYTDRGIRAGQCFTYRLRACRADGICSDWSAETGILCQSVPEKAK